MTTPIISVIIATRNRGNPLRRMLTTLDRVQPLPVAYEVIAVNNGSSDNTPQILAEWAGNRSDRRVLRVEQQGKSRALNAGVRAAQGDLLAFLDDDVEVDSAYLVKLWKYFETHDCAAAQGAILWPAEVKDDPELQRLLVRYRSCVVRADFPPNTHDGKLRGANIAVRRSVFDKIGLFDEWLGPGATGFSEDDELADRILASGCWIGYCRAAQVTHEIDASRLTDAYFRERHRKQGRSRYVYKANRLFGSILPNLVNAVFHCILYGALRNVPKLYRARGRYYHYREMLTLALRRRS